MKKRILILSFLLCICFSVNSWATDPVLVDCPIDTWTKVATNTNRVEIDPMIKTRYLYTLRDTGGASPANNDDSLLLQSFGVDITARPAVDVYIKTQRNPGIVRVAVFSDTVIVSVEASALPAGASTSANQDIIISSHGDKLNRLEVTSNAIQSVMDKFVFQESTGFQTVHAGDAHYSPLDLHATSDTSVFTTMGVGGASAGVSSFDVTTGAGSIYTNGDIITIKQGATTESNTNRIISIATDTLTIDSPLENTYLTSAVVRKVELDISLANGTITTPVVYTIAPPSGEVYHITTVAFKIEDGVQPGIELFGGIGELTNGFVVRYETSLENKTLQVLRNNGDMIIHFGVGNVSFTQKIGGGDYSTDATWPLEENTTSIVRLDGDQGDVLKFMSQDNLTALTKMEAIVYGHREE